MKLLESLVADKEALRKSNVELQDLLSESRETLQALQEEAGERVQVGTSRIYQTFPHALNHSSQVKSHLLYALTDPAMSPSLPLRPWCVEQPPGPFPRSRLFSRRMTVPRVVGVLWVH